MLPRLRKAAFPRPRSLAALLAVTLAGGLLPAAVLAASPPADGAAGLRPTIQYEEAVAHAERPDHVHRGRAGHRAVPTADR